MGRYGGTFAGRVDDAAARLETIVVELKKIEDTAFAFVSEHKAVEERAKAASSARKQAVKKLSSLQREEARVASR